ncbi:RDD family protein [Vibrio profundum]|uniref:RDD family protein n=1 Tax=Vibrio profundum TaxID=2910247 RepID=UPI003D0E8A8C
MNSTAILPQAGLFRRIGALSYDCLIIIAIEMIAVGVVVAILQASVKFQVFSYQPYLDIADFLTHQPIWSFAYKVYLVAVWLTFLIFFWTKAGQTLGMRAWKIKVVNQQGENISALQALIRVLTSIFGLANLTILLDPKKRGLQDLLSKTRVVVLPK